MRIEEIFTSVFEHLLDALLDAAAVFDQVKTRPSEVSDVAHLLLGHEGGREHRSLGELRQPDRVELVGLRGSGDVSHLLRVDEPDTEARAFEHVEERSPVVRRRLQYDAFDPLFDEVLRELGDRLGAGLHLPHLCHPLARHTCVRDPGADHAAGLGDVDRGDTFHDLVLLSDLDLLGALHRLLILSWGRLAERACLGVRWELHNLTGVLVATVRDPSRGAPAPG